MEIVEADYGQMLCMLSNGEAVVLDVRTKKEYDKWHVKGSINIPKEEIEEIADEEDEIIKELKQYINDSKKIILYCKTENRSLHCMKILQKYDIECIILKGGISNFLPNTD